MYQNKNHFFLGSPKPIWNDDYNDDDIDQTNIVHTKFHSVECSPGRVCSQTIPLWNDIATNEIYDVQPQIKSTFRPIIRSTMTTSNPSTMGLSVASIYNQRWPSPTPTRSKITRRPPANLNTKSPSYAYFDQSPIYAETLEEPVYNKFTTNRYDPFIFHKVNQVKKKSRPSPIASRPQKSYDQFSSSSSLNPSPKVYSYTADRIVPNHYTDSRFGISSDPVKVSSQEMFRSSLTWKSKPSSVIEHEESTRKRGQHFNNQNRNYFHEKQLDRRRINYQPNYDNYREASSPMQVQASRYFPGGSPTSTFTYPAIRDQPMINKPSRNYFPVNNKNHHYNEEHPKDDLDRYDIYKDAPNPYVGEEQQVIAGYTVEESSDPNEYLSSAYYQDANDDNAYQQSYVYPPDLTTWYDLTTTTTTSKPYVPRLTTVKPWTSLDLAKPDWEETDRDFRHESNQHRGGSSTYGAWNKDNLKLEAVPFSRDVNGKERKWVLLNSSAARKKKVVIPSNARHLVIKDNLGLQVSPNRE